VYIFCNRVHILQLCTFSATVYIFCNCVHFLQLCTFFATAYIFCNYVHFLRLCEFSHTFSAIMYIFLHISSQPTSKILQVIHLLTHSKLEHFLQLCIFSAFVSNVLSYTFPATMYIFLHIFSHSNMQDFAAGTFADTVRAKVML